jgi:hypothetical protein
VALTEKQIGVIATYVQTQEMAASYSALFTGTTEGSLRASATAFFKRPEVKRLVKKLTEQREKVLFEANEAALKKIYTEQIASETELDIYHTKVVRGEVFVQDIFAVKEKHIVEKVVGNKKVPMVEEKVVFKKIDRLPNVRERQLSAHALYLRKGSYKPLKYRNVDGEQDDQAAALKAKQGQIGNGENEIQRVVILSDGTPLPLLFPIKT